MMHLYIKNAYEAFKLYEAAFGTKGQIYGTDENGNMTHAEINVRGQVISLSETESDEVVVGNTMQFIFDMGAGYEDFIQNAHDVLMVDAIKYDGPVGECEFSTHLFSLIDEFGVSWMIFA